MTFETALSAMAQGHEIVSHIVPKATYRLHDGRIEHKTPSGWHAASPLQWDHIQDRFSGEWSVNPRPVSVGEAIEALLAGKVCLWRAAEAGRARTQLYVHEGILKSWCDLYGEWHTPSERESMYFLTGCWEIASV